MTLIAAGAAFDPANPGTWWQAGSVVVGIMVVVTMFLKGWIVVGTQYTRLEKELSDEKARNAVLKAENDKVHDRLEGEVFSTLKACAVALATANDLLRGFISRDRGRGIDGSGGND